MTSALDTNVKGSPSRAPFSLWGWYFVFGVLAFVVLGWCIFYPGLNSPFLLDDTQNFATLDYFKGKIGLPDVLLYLSLDSSSAIGRPVSVLTFLLNRADWPANPFGFKIVNLGIHLFIYALVAALMYRLLVLVKSGISQRQLAILSIAFSAIWLLSPMQTSTIFYSVQRIAQIAALFSLLAVHAYLSYRTANSRTGKSVAFVCLGLVMALGFLSKENAFLIFLALLLIEVYFFKMQGGVATKVLISGMVVIPAVAILIWLLVGPFLYQHAYGTRTFTLGQRLMTEVYCLKDYFFQFLVPDVARISVFHDDLKPISSIFDPRFVGGCLFFGVAFFAIYYFYSRNKLISFGLAWYFAWHSVEASAVPLELYFEHRNYLPSVGIVIMLVGFWQYLEALVKHEKQKWMVTTLALYLVVITGLVYLEAKKWEHPLFLATRWVQEHPGSKRAVEFLTLVKRAYGIKGNEIKEYDQQIKSRPGQITPLLMLKLESCDAGKDYIDDKAIENFKQTSTYEISAIITLDNILTKAETKSCKVPIDLGSYERLLNRYAERPDLWMQRQNIYLMLQRIAKLEGDPEKEDKYFWDGYKYEKTAMYGILYYIRLKQLGKYDEAHDLLLNMERKLSHKLLPLKNIFGLLYVKWLIHKNYGTQ